MAEILWGRCVLDACDSARKDRAARLINELADETYLFPGDIERCDRCWLKLLDWDCLFTADVHTTARFLGLRTEF
jgi:hypothetical protein